MPIRQASCLAALFVLVHALMLRLKWALQTRRRASPSQCPLPQRMQASTRLLLPPSPTAMPRERHQCPPMRLQLMPRPLTPLLLHPRRPTSLIARSLRACSTALRAVELARKMTLASLQRPAMTLVPHALRRPRLASDPRSPMIPIGVSRTSSLRSPMLRAAQRFLTFPIRHGRLIPFLPIRTLRSLPPLIRLPLPAGGAWGTS